jgi:RHS repeat-associated protein
VVPRVRRVASYEGQGGDPRVTEELVLAYDSWGAPTRTAQVAYARRGAVDDAAQARTWVTVTDSGRADVDVDGQFLLGAELEASQLELVGVAPVGGRLGVEALTAPAVVAALAAPASFEQALDPAATAPAARRLSWQRTYYWDAARATPAAFGVVPKAPRVHHAEVACLTPGLVAATLAPRIDAAGVAALGYVLADGHWWQRGPVQEVGGPFGLVTRTVRGDGATAEQVYDDDQLVVTAQIDALGLSTTSLIDYRVMAPARTTDPNGMTRSAVHDGFGRVVASGVEGHVGAQPWKSGTAIDWAAGAATVASVLADPAGYLADAATATLIDDRAWARDATPVAEVTVARRVLVDDGAGGGDKDAPEVRVRYLDGFGRVLQEKVRVEAGPAIQRDASGAVIVDAGGRPVLASASERWQVSGHVVYDAKGQPGRVYEPYFSPSAAYEGDAVLARFGVSTLTTYDAVGRPVRVDLPNGTYATTTHGAWATTAATPGDTVLDSTYRVVREGRPVDDAERVAYEHAAGHAGTPTVTYVDARGAACATRAVGDASAADAWTRQVLDATGQAGAVIDARGLTAFTYVRDLRGRVVAQASVDAGPTWALADAYDRPVWTWDARGFAVTRGFDVADRPTTVHVTGGDGVTAMDAVVETYLYGDQAADRAAAVAANTVGRLVEVKDGAGVVSVSAYDPLGAVRAQGRRLRATVDEAPDWRGAEALESEVLTTVARTDALGREVWTALVDGTVRASTYARGGALASVRVTTPDGALVEAPIVEGLTRDAHGRVVAATLGNGVGQTWAYDPASGRLVAQDAVRGTRAYQGLRCTYDPDGKLVRMLDVAQDGPGALVPGAVSARRDFGYDAHGRLVEATGRVHQALLPHDGPTTAGCVHGARHLSLNNGAALERYTQRFSYDAGGNLTRVQHAGTTASWATDYWVAAGSNRSTAAEDSNGVPVVNPAGMFDAGGNLRELWHLRAMGWSWRGCLTHATTVARPSGPVDDGERYAYGADRVRVRKVATRLVVGGAEPVVETREVVYCGGGQERVRVARNGTLVLERWTTHVSDGDRRVAVIDRHVVDTLANEVDAIGPARVRYHLTTPQGSTAVELDEAGLLISYEEYLPFGGSAFVAGDDVREVARRDVRYAGKERDRATGLDAYPQRYYAPWLGRWLSPDPIGPKDGLNLYAFVGGDPVGYVDPEGTDRAKAPVSEAELGFVNFQIDKNHNRVIEAGEIGGLDAFASVFHTTNSRETLAAWQGAMRAWSGAGFRTDDTVGALVRSGAGAAPSAASIPELVELNRLIDVNGDHVIDIHEFSRTELYDNKNEGLLWGRLMAATGGAGYHVTAEVAAWLPANATRGLVTHDYIKSEAALSLDGNGRSYTERGDREAAQRELHKYEDPRRGIAIAQIAVTLLVPEAVAVYEAGAAGFAAGEFITGRDGLTGAKKSRADAAADFGGHVANAGLAVVGRGEIREGFVGAVTPKRPAFVRPNLSAAEGSLKAAQEEATLGGVTMPDGVVGTTRAGLANSPQLAAEHTAGGQAWFQALPKPLRDKVAQAHAAAQVEYYASGRIVASDTLRAGSSDLQAIRARYGLSSGDTVAAAKTDIPSLKGDVFEGLSPRHRKTAGLGSLDDVYGSGRPIKSPNSNPIASRHAEEDALNALAKAIDSLGIAPEGLHGYTVSLHISNAKGVCDTCFQGLGPSNAKAGVLRQFSERYPGLTIQVTAENASARMGRPVITIRGGKILD